MIELYDFKPVSLNKPVEEALRICDEEGLSHLPVMRSGQYAGMIRCEDLETFSPGDRLSSAAHFMENFHVFADDDWTKLFAGFLSNETNIVPVLDEHGIYQGVYLLEDLLQDLSEIKAFNIPGKLIRLQKNAADFSFGEVGRIVESNGGKLLGILLIDETPAEIIADIKIESGDVNEILQSLRRYDYVILSQHEEDTHLQELREHADYLSKYLKMGE